MDKKIMPQDTTPASLSAVEAARKIRDGELTSEELVQSCLDRIEALEDTVGAWTHLDREYALAQAKAAQEWRQAGKSLGPLHGVPVGIKDIFDTRGMPTENPVIAETRREARVIISVLMPVVNGRVSRRVRRAMTISSMTPESVGLTQAKP